MKPILTLLSGCLLAATTLCGQDTSFKKNAIFLTYEEFKNNTPSIDTLTLYLNEKKDYKNVLQYKTGNGDWANFKSKLWGFSDSTDIYIKHDGYYGLVIATGRYYIFSHMEYAEKSQTAISPVTHAPIVLRSQPVETKIYYILDYQTGQIEELKAKKVKKILEEDPELLKEYQDEFNQQGLVVQYIRRYNEKHPAQ